MANPVRYRSGESRIVGIIGDEDTVTGFLLAGVGDNKMITGLSKDGQAAINGVDTGKQDTAPNYFVVTNTTTLPEIEEAFTNMCNRKDIGIIIICQHIAADIRHLIQQHTQTIPCILEIPSRGQKYDADKDSVLNKINRALGVR